jgi:hypothetical protein
VVAPGSPAAAAPADGTVRTFDDEPLGEAPADCRIEGDVTVAEAAFGGATETNRAMRIVDQDPAVYTRAWCDYPQTEERSVSYRFSPAQLDAGPYVAIQGAPGTSSNGVWRFTFNRAGDDIRIDAYDGSSFADVATIAGGATLDEWVDVTINATTERAEIIVNGVRFETDRRNAPSPTMGEIYFGSAGYSAVGVDYYIDDLAVSGELPEDAFAGLTLEPVFDGAGLTAGAEVTDAPVARFQLPEGAEVSDYSAEVEWQGETVPATLSGPDDDGWVTASITHTFSRVGVNTLRTVVTDSAGNQADSTQQVTVAGDLGELTFESDDVGAVPAECSTLDGYDPATVSDELASGGSQSLRIHDTSTEAAVGVACPVVPQQGAYLAFQVHPQALEGFTFDLIGESLRPTDHPANSLFRLAVRADGSIEWYEQWTATWRQLAPAGTVAPGEWSQVELAVPSDNAAVRVSVDGEYVGSAGSTIGNNSGSTNEVTSITGFMFTTGATGVGATGDDVFVDDVTFGTPDDTPPAAVGTAPFDIADTVTIDDTGEQVGFPLGGVVLPTDDGGRRVLIPYSAHPDRIDASGFLIGASDDDGASWFSGVDINPMPDASGITLTRLRNGDLIAVDYNTFMIDGSGNRQATVETSVSGVGGATWEHRDGVLETPEPMRPIGATSPRPGTTLGGFVLLHTLLEDPDGTLYISAYGYYEGDEKYRQVLLVSHDSGINWEVAGTVTTADPELIGVQAYDGPSEGAIERLDDGSMFMVMRTGWHLPMIYSRSYDDGATWTEPQEIEVGPDGQDLLSVQPTMERLPSGELLLMVGRPGLVMTMSESGLGDDWTVPVGVDYANSENGSFTVIDSMHVLAAGDRGRMEPWEVWSRNVTIAPPCEQTVTGEHSGPLTAGEGGLCLDGASVDGDVDVADGGRLIVQDSDVTGTVTATGASVVAICGSSVTGAVTATGTTASVAIGDTTSGCEQSTIDGPLTVSGTTGPVVVDRSEVGGDVTISGNTGRMATVLSGLTVDGSLTCTDNAVVPTESGVPMDVAGERTGQCGDDDPGEPEVPVVPAPGIGYFLANGWGPVADSVFEFGRASDEAFTGDWDGDGVDTLALRRGNTIHVTNDPSAASVEPPFTYGRAGDVLLAGDFDGDGTDTFAVRRGNDYLVLNTLVSGNADVEVTYGRASDDVLVGDWDGDGLDTFAVRRGNAFFVANEVRDGWADEVISYGRVGDTVLVGDWDGDGLDTFAVRRGNAYFVRNEMVGGNADIELTYGRAGDTVLVGDWDGDGSDTLGVRR